MKKKWKWLLLIIPVILILAYFGYVFYFRYSFIQKYKTNLIDYGDGTYLSQSMVDGVGVGYAMSAPRLLDGTGGGLEVDTPQVYYMDDDGVVSENPCEEYYSGNVSINPYTYKIKVRVVIGYEQEDGSIGIVQYDLDKDKNPIDQENWSSVQKEQFDQQQDVIDEIYLHLNEQWGIVEK